MINIENYIRENLRKGAKLENIKKALHLSGYKAEDIEKSVKRVYREQITDIAKYINREIKQGLHSSSVRNYLLALGHPRAQVDDAIEKIISAKKALIMKKRIEKTKERFRQIKKNIYRNIKSKFYSTWDGLKPWQRGAYIPAAILSVILFCWVIVMMINSIILSGSLNCYSFGRVISCSFFESLLFYLLLMLAFIVIFCLPVFGLGALIGYLTGRFRE